LIDNASRESLSSSFDLGWHVRGRHVLEAELGLTRARLRGISEACADLLIFVDDDNILDCDYLEQALRVFQEWPQLGTWGGQCIPEFETPPAEWTRRWWNWIAIREFSSDQWSNLVTDSGAMPCGAGMCVRRRVAVAYQQKLARDQARTMLDRTGERLLAGGDTDICYSSCELGLGNGIFAAMKLTHLIPPIRLERSYLLKLVESMAYSDALLRYFQGGTISKPSKSQRLLKWYQGLHVSKRDRLFDRARERGAEAARLEFARLEKESSANTTFSRKLEPEQ